MNTYTNGLPSVLFAAAAIAISASATASWAGHEVIEFDEADLFLEENTTDGDLGLHFKVDGEGWNRLILTTARYSKLLDVRVHGNLGREIGLTEIFSESAEPGFDELPREDFLKLFPEGDYKFFGRTLEGDWLVGIPTLTHDIPKGPEITSPEEDEEIDPEEDFEVK